MITQCEDKTKITEGRKLSEYLTRVPGRCLSVK